MKENFFGWKRTLSFLCPFFLAMWPELISYQLSIWWSLSYTPFLVFQTYTEFLFKENSNIKEFSVVFTETMNIGFKVYSELIPCLRSGAVLLAKTWGLNTRVIQFQGLVTLQPVWWSQSPKLFCHSWSEFDLLESFLFGPPASILLENKRFIT